METYPSTSDYNAAYPERAFPDRRTFEEDLTHLHLECEDERNMDVIVTFLPGGLDGDWERRGNVVARAWSDAGRVDVLGVDVTLREAFAAALRTNEVKTIAHSLGAATS